MGLNLASLLTQTARRHPDAAALRVAGAPAGLTYGALADRALAFGGALRERGVEPGDRVGILAPNVPDFAIAYWGTLAAGAVVVPMNPLLKTREIAYYLRDSGASVFAHLEAFGEHAVPGAQEAGVEHVVGLGGASFGALLDAAKPLADVVPRSPDEAAVLLYTSGTTGEPKGATLTHSNMTWNAHISATQLLDLQPGERVVGTLPLFHSFGQSVAMNAALSSGAELVLVPRFEPGPVLDLIESGAEIFLGVPTMYTALLNTPGVHDRKLDSLRLCISGGAPLPVEILRGCEELFGCPLLEGYGLSETSPVATFNSPTHAKPGSIGRPIHGVELQVVDGERAELPDGEIGEIRIRGHNVMSGYFGRPQATADAIDEHGWFSTGDLARRDEDGFYFIVDRSKDLILRGGMNVYPREIEEVLYEHPDVLEAAVVGVPHDELGEEVGAFVAVKPGATFDADALREHVRERIAAYKYPRVVVQVETLPKGPTGKILKREIDVAALLAERA